METYLVGGAVRDELLGREVKERDYVVVGATVQEMINLGFTQVGKDFPVFLHPETKEEYALARTERKHGRGYTGFICEFSPDITLEQDLLRRDLTVNAIAKDSQNRLIDPYHGQQDLNKRLLRHVSDAFSEDPLRVLRVARFAARYAYLGFTIADETIALMEKMTESGELNALTPERVWQEWHKALEDGAFDIFLRILHQVGTLALLHSALDKLCSETYLKRLRQRLNYAGQKNAELALHFVQVTAGLDSEEIESLASSLRLSNEYRDLAVRFSRYQSLLSSPEQDPALLLECFNATDLWRRPQQFTQLLEAVEIYHLGKVDIKRVKKAAEAASQVNAQDCIAEGITGADIKPAMHQRRLAAIARALRA